MKSHIQTNTFALSKGGNSPVLDRTASEQRPPTRICGEGWTRQLDRLITTEDKGYNGIEVEQEGNRNETVWRTATTLLAGDAKTTSWTNRNDENPTPRRTRNYTIVRHITTEKISTHSRIQTRTTRNETEHEKNKTEKQEIEFPLSSKSSMYRHFPLCRIFRDVEIYERPAFPAVSNIPMF